MQSSVYKLDHNDSVATVLNESKTEQSALTL